MGMRRMGEDEARSQTFYPPWRAGQSLLHSHTPSQPIRISKTDGKSSTECLECRSVQSQALQSLLREPVHFQPATRVTFEDEERMTPTLRSRVVRVDENGPINQDQINNCEITSSISGVWQHQAPCFPASRGLNNPLNRCYRNSVLQALFHIPKLVNWMEVDHRGCVVQRCTLCSLRKLCIGYWNQPEDGHAIDAQLKALDLNLRRTRTFRNDQWQFSVQNDANLFLVNLLAAILETNPGLTDVLNSLLGHSTVTMKTCAACGWQTVRKTLHEQDRILHVGWDQETSLEQILRDREFNENVHHDLNCSRCKEKGQHPYSKRLWTAPDVLIIHFMRFRPHRKRTGYQKSKDNIVFQEELNLTALTEANMQLHYNLQAVVHHAGDLDSGHYIAVTKGPHGTWEWIDDRSVTHTTVKAALDTSHPHVCGDPWTPYLLFYVKTEGRGLFGNPLRKRSGGQPSKNIYVKALKATKKRGRMKKRRGKVKKDVAKRK